MSDALKFFLKEEDKKKAFYLLAGISELGNALDVVCFTPLRDIQVFANKTFTSMSGPTHPILSGVLLGTSIVACLPYLAKIFNRNKADTLQDVLEHSDREFKTTFLNENGALSDEKKQKLNDYFNSLLAKKENSCIEAKLVEKTKGLFKKRRIYDIRYQFSSELSALLKGKGNISSEDLLAQKDISPRSRAFLEKILISGKTLAESREIFFRRFDKITATDIVKATAEGAADVSFQYWLVFFVFDMFYSNADSTAWNLKAQFIALGAALGITLLKFGVKIWSYFKDQWKNKKMEEALSKNEASENSIKYADQDLKREQLSTFYIEELKKHNAKKLEDESYKIKVESKKDIKEILQAELAQKNWRKKLKHRFFSIVKSVEEHESILLRETRESKSFNQKMASVDISANTGVAAAKEIPQAELVQKNWRKKLKHRFFSIVKSVQKHGSVLLREIREPKSFNQKMASVNISINTGIAAAFVNWVGGAAVNAFYQLKTASSAVSHFLDGVVGGILGVLSFVLGTILGIAYYKLKLKPKLDQAKEELRKKFEDNRKKINFLQKLELENQKMRAFLKTEGVERLPTLKPSSDRAFRRLTTQKTKAFTLFKKSVNRATTFIGKMGSGILLFRFVPLAIAACVGISLTAAVSAVLWPLITAALVVGLIWGGIYLYQYIEERRIESSKTFLAQLDLRIEVAQNHNAELRSQLREEEPHADPKPEIAYKGENSRESMRSSETNNERAIYTQSKPSAQGSKYPGPKLFKNVAPKEVLTQEPASVSISRIEISPSA